MKRILWLTLLIAPLGLLGQTSFMSFNLRYDNPQDGQNAWPYRRAEVTRMIQHYKPDILGIQEGLVSQVMFLDSALSDYDYVGVGREDGQMKGEYAAIFYNKKRIRLVDTKTWWLSETPDRVSIGWDAALERIVTFARFVEIKHNDTLYVFNTHFDHMGKLARERSAQLILHLIDSLHLRDRRLVVMGDLNSAPDEPAVLLFQSTFETADSNTIPIQGPEGTFNEFNTEKAVTERIDFIFVKNMELIGYRHISDKRKNGLWLSDHLPVMAKVNW